MEDEHPTWKFIMKMIKQDYDSKKGTITRKDLSKISGITLNRLNKLLKLESKPQLKEIQIICIALSAPLREGLEDAFL